MTITSLFLLVVATPGQQPRASDLTPRIEYYLSESRVISPEGKPLGALVGLGRREYRPSERTITQMDIALDPDPGARPTVVTLEWAIDGATAVIQDRDGKLKGRARLGGPAWNWTEWAWNGVMKDVPGTFRTTSKATRHGYSVRTEHLDESGKRLEVFDQVDTRITKETYDILRGRFLPQ
jgi:hypothetical protein